MNRRQFNVSLAALVGSPKLPMGVSAATAPKTAFVPAGTYAWAELIARAQTKCSPAMLAQHLRLPKDAAQQLFNELLRDGVLHTQNAAGIAQAAEPMNATGTGPSTLREILGKWMPSDEQSDKAPPLAKDADHGLGCDEHQSEDQQDASAREPVQDSPQER